MLTAALTLAATAPDLPPLVRAIALVYKAVGGPGRVELTGSMTYAVDLAMMPAAGTKLLLVLVEDKDATGAATTAPITIQWTSASVQKSQTLNAAAGVWGAFLLADPAPTSGPTALNLISTANAVAHVYALG